MMPWLLHSTTADRVGGIAFHGLVPSSKPRWSGKLGRFSKGKVFFGPKVALLKNYAVLAIKSMPVMLRVHSSALPDAIKEPRRLQGSEGDVYVERVVPPQDIEVWLPLERAWVPVELANEFFGPVKAEIPPSMTAWEFADAYFSEAWPTQKETQSGANT